MKEIGLRGTLQQQEVQKGGEFEEKPRRQEKASAAVRFPCLLQFLTAGRLLEPACLPLEVGQSPLFRSPSPRKAKYKTLSQTNMNSNKYESFGNDSLGPSDMCNVHPFASFVEVAGNPNLPKIANVIFAGNFSEDYTICRNC